MLTLENLSFDVNDEKGEIGIIKDISFTVDDGKFVVITGPNGGGKSTTAKLIMGIERPTGGRILFDGQDITDMPLLLPGLPSFPCLTSLRQALICGASRT